MLTIQLVTSEPPTPILINTLRNTLTEEILMQVNFYCTRIILQTKNAQFCGRRNKSDVDQTQKKKEINENKYEDNNI